MGIEPWKKASFTEAPPEVTSSSTVMALVSRNGMEEVYRLTLFGFGLVTEGVEC